MNRTNESSPSRSRARAVIAALLAALSLLLVDMHANRLEAPAEVSEAPAPESPEPAIELETLVVNFGADANVAGSLRIELDDGTLVREQSVLGAQAIVRDLPPGPYVVRATLVGFARLSRAIRVPCDPISFGVQPASRVTGLVVGMDGLPAEAHVRIVGSGIWPGRVVQTREGRFSIEDVPPGVYEVEASAGNFVSELRRGLEIGEASNAFLTFHLSEGRTMRGIVTDAQSGRPIGNASIRAAAESVSASVRQATTDMHGAFGLVGVRDDQISVEVLAEGYVPNAMTCNPAVACHVALARGAVVRGRVVDASHRPVAQARIEVIGEARGGMPIAMQASHSALDRVLLDPANSLPETAPPEADALAQNLGGLGTTDVVPALPLEGSSIESASIVLPALPASGSVAPIVASAPSSTFITNDNGEFEVTGLPAGRVELIARAPAYRAAHSAILYIAAGSEREGIELQLGRAGRLSGRLQDASGRGLAGRVEARIEDDPMPRLIDTNARGEFVIEDAAGAVILTALVEGFPPTEAVAHVEARATSDQTITLAHAVHRQNLRVVDPDGDALADAVIRVESLAPGTSRARMLLTDANGEVELTAGPNEALVLYAEHPRFVASPRVVVPSDAGEIELAVREPLTVTSQVLDAWTTEGVSGADIRLTCLDAEPCHRSTTTYADGRWTIHRMLPGHYRLEVLHAGHATQTREVLVRGTRFSHEVELDGLELMTGLHVEGDVVDMFGRAATEAEVEVTVNARPIHTTTNDRGHFSLEGVPPGDVNVEVRDASAGHATVRLHIVRERDPAPIVVHLPSRLEGDGSGRDRAARAVGVAVELSPAGRIASVLGEHARLSGLAPGDEILSVDGVQANGEALANALRGPTLLPALLRIRRGAHTLTVRVQRERYEAR